MNWRITKIFVLSVTLIWVAPVDAQDDEARVDDGTRYCISTRRIRHTRIVDDRNVLFYLSSRTILLNVLRETCPGLKHQNEFAFTTTTGRICEGDGLAPMADDPWGAVRPIPRCWLGVHRQITREQADEMMAAKPIPPESESVSLPMPEPSEVGVEDEIPE